jgi:hypothetical protein
MTPDDLIANHESLDKCRGWQSWLQPLIEHKIATATKTALTGTTGEAREESRHTANALQWLLDEKAKLFQSALISLRDAGKLPPYLAHLIAPSIDAKPAPPVQGGFDPGTVGNQLDMEALGADLVARFLTPPVLPAAPPP